MNLSESRKRARTKAQTCGRGGVGGLGEEHQHARTAECERRWWGAAAGRGLSLLLCDGSERSDWEGWEGGK